jgi:LysM repeat protein
MSMSTRWPLPAIPLVIAAMLLVSGCGKYDALERNMQYISSGLLQKESAVAYQRLAAAHAAWQAAPGPETLGIYKELYAQYRVIYNELMDRSSVRFGSRLGQFSETMPPPPPGVIGDAAPPTAAPASATPETAPPARDLEETTTPDQPAKPAKRAKPDVSGETDAAPDQAPATMASTEAGSYVVRPGDTPHRIAKELQVSEARLMEINGITDPNKLSVGKKLTIPER